MFPIVSILTRPEGRVQRISSRRVSKRTGFNPHPSRRTGATRYGVNSVMRLIWCFNPHPSRRTGATHHHRRRHHRSRMVSILTRPEGRVQRNPPALFQDLPSFNPHPSRRTGATCPSRFCPPAPAFQSSPVPKDGCNRRRETRETAEWGFNPHPSRRTGATPPAAWSISGPAFQSSPVPKDGCNAHLANRWANSCAVSILTRPEGRVQPCRRPR